MIVVDSSVWADWWNGADTAHTTRLERALDGEDIAILPVILTEMLQGFRTDSSFAKARSLLVRLPLVPLDAEGHVEAARLFRRLRKRGVTIRGAVDCIIAQSCIEAGAELLTRDRDFAGIAMHAPLKLCQID